jgi:membrane protein DedA with SNARE-associated domain
MLDGFVTWFESLIRTFVDHAGYFAVAALLCIDSMCIPAGSELVMSSSGMLARQSFFNLHLAVLAGVLGSGVGSAIAYAAGKYGGRPFLEKYGKFLLIRKKEIDHADKWFAKYGMAAAFIGRLIPVGHAFISLPMGIYKVRFAPFIVLSLAGSAVWCYGWAYLGFAFQSFREQLRPAMKIADIVVIVLIVAMIAYWIFKKRRAANDA